MKEKRGMHPTFGFYYTAYHELVQPSNTGNTGKIWMLLLFAILHFFLTFFRLYSIMEVK